MYVNGGYLLSKDENHAEEVEVVQSYRIPLLRMGGWVIEHQSEE
jgi:hypothetical protein